MKWTGIAPLAVMVKGRWQELPEARVLADTAATRPAADRVLGSWLERMQGGGGP